MTAFYAKLEDGIAYRLLPLQITMSKLTWAMKRANTLKLVFNAHLASTVYHTAADATNILTSPDATDLGSLVTLVNEFRTAYEAHRILVGVGPVHGSADSTHALSAPAASDIDTALALIKNIHLQLEAHRKDISGSPTIHLEADIEYVMLEYVQNIQPFGGSIDDILSMKRELSAGAPQILVQAQGATPKQVTTGGLHYRDTRVAVVLIDRTQRSQLAQRRGSGHGGEAPGIYQMIEDVCDLVVGKFPLDGYGKALQARQWRIYEERQVLGDLDIQVWILVFGCQVAHEWSQIDRSSLSALQWAEGEGDLYDGDVKTVDGLEKLRDEWP